MRVLINNDRNINLREDLVKYIGKEGRLHHKLTTKHGASVSVVEFDDGGCICWLSHMATPMSKVDPKAKKGVDMKEDNKHPHHDLIALFNEDITIKVQRVDDEGWESCNILAVVNDTAGHFTFRIKPREFIKGHWYPCVHINATEKYGQPMLFDGDSFFATAGSLFEYSESTFSFIGRSLGEIEFK